MRRHFAHIGEALDYFKSMAGSSKSYSRLRELTADLPPGKVDLTHEWEGCGDIVWSMVWTVGNVATELTVGEDYETLTRTHDFEVSPEGVKRALRLA